MRIQGVPSSVVGVFTVMLFAAAPAAAQDEGQPCSADGQLFAYGDVLTGCAIESVADLDLFHFAGSIGDDVIIIFTKTSGPGVPCLALRNPSGTPIGAQACTVNTFVIRPPSLTIAGNYQLVATEFNNDSTVGFNMSIERLFPLRGPTPLGFGELLTGRTIMPATDLDTYVFNGVPGNEVRIMVNPTSGGAPCVEVRNPDRTELRPRTCQNFLDFSLVLPQAGPYLIVLTESVNDQAMVHNIVVHCVTGPCATRPPACLVDPSFAGSTLTIGFLLGTPGPAQWHLALSLVGTTIPLFTVAVPAIDPPVSSSFGLSGFPALGRIGLLSTLTASAGITCHDFKTVATP